MNKEVKRSTGCIAVEVINDGYGFERLWTCPPEYEHTSPAEDAPSLFSKKIRQSLRRCGGAGAVRRPTTASRGRGELPVRRSSRQLQNQHPRASFAPKILAQTTNFQNSGFHNSL